MNYILGIDQGGTKTVAIIADGQGRILGVSTDSGAYFPSDGMDCAMKIMLHVSERAAKLAGIELSDVALAVVGMTGMDFPNQKEMLKTELEQTLGIHNIVVVNDCIIAMYGGTKKSVGAVICAGTGLNMAVRAGEDKEFVLGFYIEESLQGGSALARRAVRKTFDAELGLCGQTQLTQVLLDHFHAGTVDDLLYISETEPTFYTQARMLVPQIIEVAAKGDKVIDSLLKEMAQEMSDCLICGLKKLCLLDTKMDVVLSGSVLKGPNNPLTDYLGKFIVNNAPKVSIVGARYEPVVGACILGLNQLNAMTAEAEINLEQTSVANHLIRK